MPNAWAQPAGSANPLPLLLELTLNSQRVDAIVRAEELPEGDLLIDRQAWIGLGLAAPVESAAPGARQPATFMDGTPALRLSDIQGARHRLDRGAQVLHLELPAAAFRGAQVDLRPAQTYRIAASATGLMVNYDASLLHSTASGNPTFGAIVEAVGFGPWGHVLHSALVQQDSRGSRSYRLDTRWQRDFPDRLESIVIGDTVGDGGAWSRPVRYAGVRWARDFRLQPGYVYTPTLALAGESALPATVDVWVNNVRQITTTTQPGPFDLRNVPTMNGAGEVNLVVRDALGRQSVISQSFYASPRLLAPGLSDFSVEAGMLRRGWGTDTRYGPAMAATTWRHGITDATTVELRGELQRERRAAGADVATLLGHWALLRASIAASQRAGGGAREHGGLLNLALERSSPRGGFTLQHRRAGRGYAPLGEADDAWTRAQRMRSESFAAASLPLMDKVWGGISHARQRRWDGTSTSTLGLSLTMPLAQAGSLGVSFSRQFAPTASWFAGLSFTWLWDTRTLASARLDARSGDAARPTVSAQRAAPVGIGTGWRVEASAQPSRVAAASVQHNGVHALASLDLASNRDGQIALRAGAAGTIGLLGGQVYATRPVGSGSIALVDTGGVAGVPVLRNQQHVATTDAQGRALVPGMLPWTWNRISLDDSEIPLDVELREPIQEVVPASRGGVIVRFDMRRNLQALVVLRRADGSDVPPGAVVTTVPQDAQHTVGLRGEAWLTDLLAQGQRLRVEWPRGRCELTLPALDPAQPSPTLAPLTCNEVTP